MGGFCISYVQMHCLHRNKKLSLYEIGLFNNLDITAFAIILHCLFDFGSIGAVRICLAFTIANQKNACGLFHTLVNRAAMTHNIFFNLCF